jgi:hypothetical protein
VCDREAPATWVRKRVVVGGRAEEVLTLRNESTWPVTSVAPSECVSD